MSCTVLNEMDSVVLPQLELAPPTICCLCSVLPVMYADRTNAHTVCADIERQVQTHSRYFPNGKAHSPIPKKKACVRRQTILQRQQKRGTLFTLAMKFMATDD